MWNNDDLDFIKRLAYRNYQRRIQLDIEGDELSDWYEAEDEYKIRYKEARPIF